MPAFEGRGTVNWIAYLTVICDLIFTSAPVFMFGTMAAIARYCCRPSKE